MTRPKSDTDPDCEHPRNTKQRGSQDSRRASGHKSDRDEGHRQKEPSSDRGHDVETHVTSPNRNLQFVVSIWNNPSNWHRNIVATCQLVGTVRRSLVNAIPMGVQDRLLGLPRERAAEVKAHATVAGFHRGGLATVPFGTTVPTGKRKGHSALLRRGGSGRI